MPRIDSLLAIVVHQGANELRIRSDDEPKMFARGSPRRLSLPKMSEETLRDLLGELCGDLASASLSSTGRYDVTYEAPSIGVFAVGLSRGPEGPLEARFQWIRAAKKELPEASGPTPPMSPDVGTERAREAPTVPEPSAASVDSGVSERPAEPSLATRAGFAAHAELAALVARAASVRASDLHLAEGSSPFVRVDGKLRELHEPTVDLVELFALSAADRLRLGSGHSIDTAFEIEGAGRVRAHVYSTESGLAAAIRLLPDAAPTFASLQMPVAFDDVCMLPHGLVLVCGATGEGKSTTLAALAQEALRRRSILLVTLEDPIEYELAPSRSSLVRRRRIGRDCPSFAAGLRDALREDPDVLLVGEMRDAETVALALTAAETGHLVLASLHSRSAASAIERIVDVTAPERQQQVRLQLAESLRVVVSQRLLPRARGPGRLPVVEILRVNHAVSAMIREAKTAQIAHALQAGRADGMLPFERSLADRVRSGDVRLEDARAVAHDVPALDALLERGRP